MGAAAAVARVAEEAAAAAAAAAGVEGVEAAVRMWSFAAEREHSTAPLSQTTLCKANQHQSWSL
jgi:hypothetical protein